MPLAGEHTLDSFSLLQSGQTEYRRWGFESAALDLALRQAGLSLGEAVGRAPQPLRFVVSTRVTNVQRWLDALPRARFKLDPGPRVDRRARRRARRRPAASRPSTSKASIAASSARRRTPALYRRIAERVPGGLDRGSGAHPGDLGGPRRASRRITWDAAIHEWSDVEALPFPPRCLNCKPSRFGSVKRLFDFYDACEQRRDRAVRRRTVRARAGPRADPAARLALPPRRAERRRTDGFNVTEPVAGLPEPARAQPAGPGLLRA